ncbi:hypothetical protein D3C76_1360180 [compost metagenome]
MFAQQRWCGQGYAAGAVGDGAEGGVVHALETVALVQRFGIAQQCAVVGAVGPDDHLGALPGRGKARRLGLVGYGLLALMDHAHGLANGVRLFLRCQAFQAGIGRQLDVDAEPICQAPGLLDQQRVGIGDGLEVDVATEAVLLA